MSLIRRDGTIPPGGYYFQDAKTGMKFDGMSVTFNEQVGKIITHRLANPKVYPPSEPKYLTPDSVTQELDDYTCLRLGRNSSYCTGPQSPTAPRVSVNRLCPNCGTILTPHYCATCSGNKILDYLCPKCNKSFPK
jgi:predicted RNA-binding Zn-ribbon protein involved in translation (DUF1610 family)